MMQFYKIFFIFLVTLSINAQNTMLINQFEDKLILRKNFDKKGKLVNKQTFQVGKIKELSGYYEIEMLTKVYDANGTLLDEYKAEYKCKPNESSLVVMILPFFNQKNSSRRASRNSFD